MPVEQAIQEQINQYVHDNEAEQLVNEINAKVDEAISDSNDNDSNEDVDNDKDPIHIIRNVDLHDKPLCIYFAKGSKAIFKDIKSTIIKKLNEYKSLSDLYVKVWPRNFERKFCAEFFCSKPPKIKNNFKKLNENQEKTRLNHSH